MGFVLFAAVLVFAFGDLVLTLLRDGPGAPWLKNRFERRLWRVGPPLALLAIVLLFLG